MTENQLATIVYNCGIKVHKTLGPGLLESVYEECLVHELNKYDIHVGRQVSIPLIYDEIRLKTDLRADIVLNNRLLIELKSVKQISPIHFAQTLTYLKMTDIRLGLLINFGEELFKNGVKRVINGYI